MLIYEELFASEIIEFVEAWRIEHSNIGRYENRSIETNT